MNTRPLLLSVAAGVALSTVLAIAWAGPPAPIVMSSEGPATPTVPVQAAQSGPIERNHVLRGVTRAQDRALIAFTQGGRMDERPVDQGQHVEQGELLAALDRAPLKNAASSARAQVRELEARSSQVQRDQTRTANLLEAGAVSRRQFEEANTGADAVGASTARAKVASREASRQLKESRLYAPFSGTVTEISAEAGEVVSAGTPIMVLVGDGGVEVEVEAPERLAARLSPGDAVEVELTASEHTVTGRVKHVADGAAFPGRLFSVVVTLDSDEAVRPGMAAAVRFTTTQPQQVTVPLSAIFDPSGSAPRVFVVRDGIVHRQEVQLGGTVGDRVVVVDGIEGGDEIVTAGQARLLDGDAVEVR